MTLSPRRAVIHHVLRISSAAANNAIAALARARTHPSRAPPWSLVEPPAPHIEVRETAAAPMLTFEVAMAEEGPDPSTPKAARVFEDEQGVARLWSPASHVLASRLSGHLSLGIAREIATYSDRQFQRYRGSLIGFHDWADVATYATDARVFLTKWTIGASPRIHALHFLVTSKLVQMGLSVGSVALRMSITKYGVRARFDAALAGVLREPAPASPE